MAEKSQAWDGDRVGSLPIDLILVKYRNLVPVMLHFLPPPYVLFIIYITFMYGMNLTI